MDQLQHPERQRREKTPAEIIPHSGKQKHRTHLRFRRSHHQAQETRTRTTKDPCQLYQEETIPRSEYQIW